MVAGTRGARSLPVVPIDFRNLALPGFLRDEQRIKRVWRIMDIRDALALGESREDEAGKMAKLVEVNIGDEGNIAFQVHVPDSDSGKSTSNVDRPHIEVRDAVAQQT